MTPQDRYLRFGYPATDEQIERYVSGLNFVRDEIFGVFNRRLELVAMAHLAYSVDPQWATCAEFGVSVDTRQRGKGLGAKLFRHAVMHARNEGVRLMFAHALSENTAMLAAPPQALGAKAATTQADCSRPQGKAAQATPPTARGSPAGRRPTQVTVEVAGMARRPSVASHSASGKPITSRANSCWMARSVRRPKAKPAQEFKKAL